MAFLGYLKNTLPEVKTFVGNRWWEYWISGRGFRVGEVLK